MTRIRTTSLYVAISLLLSMVVVPVLGTQTASAAAPDPQGTIYVADCTANAIDVFAPGSTGNVAPERSIVGTDTGLSNPCDVEVDAAGDVYAGNLGNGSITEYAPQASGDAAPICTISGSNTDLTSNGIDDFSLEPDGTLVVGTYDNNSVLVFAPGSCGNVAPVEVIAGSNTGFDIVDGVGTDARGTIYAVNSDGNSIEVFPAGANGNVAPEYSISGSNTGLTGPDDIVVGFDGELYVSSAFTGASSLLVYAAGATGNATPLQDISGSNTGFGEVDDLAVDDSGNIYVTDITGNDVDIFAAGTTGNVAPTAVIGGSNTTFEEPEGVAIAGPAGSPVGASVTTAAAATSISLGSPTSDTATITEGTNGDAPTGSLVFKLFGPNDATCSNAPAYVSSAQSVSGAGAYSSGSFTPTAVGTYTWQALYSGDTNNAPVTTACSGIAAETVTVQKASPQPTSIATSLSGGGQSGASITVPSGTAVTDTSTLSGTNAATATGTVTYNVYSDSGCTTLASGGTPETITTPGTLPASAPVTLPSAGTYYWGVSYSGDTDNASSVSTCGAAGEVETVSPSPQPTSVSTSLSGGGQSGTSITVPSGTAVTDTSTLSGTNAATATGTVTYNVYSDSGCTTLASGGTPETITTPGTLPASAPVTLPAGGTYYWQSVYSGDAQNESSTSTCGSETETVTSTVTPQPTMLKTLLKGSGSLGGHRCWWDSDVITVFSGASVTDSATLSGANASTAGGTVTYTVYARERVKKDGHWCWEWVKVADGGTVTLRDGQVPNSKPVTLPTGVYEWQASFSGDSANQSSSSRFGSETEIVVPASKCTDGWTRGNDSKCRDTDS